MLIGLLEKHAKYRAFAKPMFKAVDEHDIAKANEIDEELADPLFDDIEKQVFQQRHGIETMRPCSLTGSLPCNG